MTVAIGSNPAFLTLRINMVDTFGRSVVKTTLLDGTTDDTTMLQILNDFNDLSNAKIVSASLNGRAITGMNASATDAIFNEVTALAELTFSRTNPVNTAKTLLKSFSIPCIKEAVVNTDKSLNVGTPGTGSLPAKLGRLVSNLSSQLAFIGSDGAVYSGSFGYSSSKSGKVSAPGV